MRFKKISDLPLIERLLWTLDAAIGFGLISGAALASLTGNFLLACILMAVATGVLIRLFRKKRRRAVGQRPEADIGITYENQKST